MSHVEIITCRLCIQVCVGYLPNGRKSYRSFSMRGIRPDASWEAIESILRALQPVLAYPITKVEKVTSRKIIFYEDATPASAWPVESVIMLDQADTVCQKYQKMPVWEAFEFEEEHLNGRMQYAPTVLLPVFACCLRPRVTGPPLGYFGEKHHPALWAPLQRGELRQAFSIPLLGGVARSVGVVFSARS